MHRSGTSLITRSLKALNIELGTDLLAAQADNETGFWEDAELHQLAEEILLFLDRSWDSLHTYNNVDVKSLLQSSYFVRAVELIRRKIDKAEVNYVGIKNPRMALILPFWKEVFSEVGVPVHFILSIRNPVSVAQSLATRNGFAFEKSYVLWMQHTVGALEQLKADELTVVSYDRMLENPRREIESIALHLGLPFNERELQDYSASFVSPQLRHTRFQLSDLEIEANCLTLVKKMFAQLEAHVEGSLELKNLLKSAKRWAKQLEELSPIIKYLGTIDLELARKKKETLDQEALVDEEENQSNRDQNAILSKIESAQSQASQLSAQLEAREEIIFLWEERLANAQKVILEVTEKLAQTELANAELRRVQDHLEQENLVQAERENAEIIRVQDHLEQENLAQTELANAELTQTQNQLVQTENNLMEEQERARMLGQSLDFAAEREGEYVFRLEEMTAQSKKFQLERDGMVDDFERSQSREVFLERQLDEGNTKLSALEALLSSLRITLNESREQHKNSESKVAVAMETIEYKNAMFSKLDKRAQGLLENNQTLQSDQSFASEKLRELEMQVRRYRGCVNTKKQQLQFIRTHRRLSELQLYANVQAALDHSKALEKNFNDLRSSTSWRFTRPLRVLSRIAMSFLWFPSAIKRLGVYGLYKEVVSALRADGLRGFFHRVDVYIIKRRSRNG
jgi:hypothetical protein